MEEWQKTHIDQNLPTLIEYTLCTTKLLGSFVATGILVKNDVEIINSKPNDLSKSMELYNILKGRANAFSTLKDILSKEKQSGALQILNQTENIGVGDSLPKLFCDKTKLLGTGCMNTKVYKGLYGSVEVAVKTISFNDETELKHALKEVAYYVGSLGHHENIVRYYTAEQTESCLQIALELCGKNLGVAVKENMIEQSSMPDVLFQITKGVDFLHKKSIIHRDIKPKNILLKQNPRFPGQFVVKIADFGISKIIDDDATKVTVHSSSGVGTEGWMSPEQLEKFKPGNHQTKVGYATDIFSLGCVYYYVLSNENHPFGDNIHSRANIADDNNQMKVTEIPDNFRSYFWLIRVMISKFPVQRPSAEAILNHPIFWPSDTTLKFISEINYLLENNFDIGGPFYEKFLSTIRRVGGVTSEHLNGWVNHLCPAVRKYLQENIGEMLDFPKKLIHVISELYNNYIRLPDNIKNCLGAMGDEFLFFWTSRFPFLVPILWISFEEMGTELKEVRLISYYRNFHRSYLSRVAEEAIVNAFTVAWKDPDPCKVRDQLPVSADVIQEEEHEIFLEAHGNMATDEDKAVPISDTITKEEETLNSLQNLEIDEVVSGSIIASTKEDVPDQLESLTSDDADELEVLKISNESRRTLPTPLENEELVLTPPDALNNENVLPPEATNSAPEIVIPAIEQNGHPLPSEPEIDPFYLALHAICLNDIPKLMESCRLLEIAERKSFLQIFRTLDKNITGSFLHFAVMDGCFKAVENILNMDVGNILEQPSMHDLLHMCLHNSIQDTSQVISSKIQIVKMLISRNPQLLNEYNGFGELPIHVPGIHLELLCILIPFGDLRATGPNGRTVMHTAPQSCSSASDYHRLVNLVIKNGQTEVFLMRSKDARELPLHCAVEHVEVSVETLELMRSQKVLDLNSTDSQGNTVFMRAVIGQRSSEFLQLLHSKFQAKRNALDIERRSPLHIAAMFGNLDAARYFIQECPELIRITDFRGRTPLHCVFLQEEDKKNNWLEITQELVENGVNVDARMHVAYRSKTAFHLLLETCFKYETPTNCIPVIKYLINAGAKLDEADEDGNAMLRLLQMSNLIEV